MPGRVLLSLLLLAGSAVAAEPFGQEPTAPYTWRVLLQIAPHRTLGPAVRKQLVADLKAALGPALGDELGTLTITDLADVPKEKWEPLWKKFDADGWAALDADEFRTFTDVKTHFLTLREENGRYVLQSRQHDGSTGMASPGVRTKTVPDLDTLSRTAGLMLAADFGPVATAEPLPDQPDSCIIRMRGGELPGADRWLKVGDIYQFAVVQDRPRQPAKEAKPAPVRPGQKIETPTDRRGQPQPYTLLRVARVIKPGVAKCDLISRYTPPLYASPFVAGRYIVGYRAMRVSTREARVSVTLADKEGKPPAPSDPLTVWASEFGPRAFGPSFTLGDRDQLARRSDTFTSTKDLRGIATVVVKLGGEPPELFPVPVLDHGEPHHLTVGFNADSVRRAKFEERAERLLDRALDARLAQKEMFDAVGRLIDKAENKQALARAESGLKNYAAVDETLTKEVAALRAEPEAKDARPTSILTATDRVLADLRADRPVLEGRIEELKSAVAKADNPAEYEREFKAKEIGRRIATYVKRGEIPEALDEYDRLIELTKTDQAKALKAKLEEEWKPKDDAHAAARKYLTDEFGKLNTREEFDAAIPMLGEKVKVLAANDDRLGLRLAVTVMGDAAVRLGDQVANLDAGFEDDRKKIEAVKKTADALRKVDEQVRTELQRVEDLKAEKKPDEEKKPDDKPPEK